MKRNKLASLALTNPVSNEQAKEVAQLLKIYHELYDSIKCHHPHLANQLSIPKQLLSQVTSLSMATREIQTLDKKLDAISQVLQQDAQLSNTLLQTMNTLGTILANLQAIQDDITQMRTESREETVLSRQIDRYHQTIDLYKQIYVDPNLERFKVNQVSNESLKEFFIEKTALLKINLQQYQRTHHLLTEQRYQQLKGIIDKFYQEYQEQAKQSPDMIDIKQKFHQVFNQAEHLLDHLYQAFQYKHLGV